MLRAWGMQDHVEVIETEPDSVRKVAFGLFPFFVFCCGLMDVWGHSTALLLDSVSVRWSVYTAQRNALWPCPRTSVPLCSRASLELLRTHTLPPCVCPGWSGPPGRPCEFWMSEEKQLSVCPERNQRTLPAPLASSLFFSCPPS